MFTLIPYTLKLLITTLLWDNLPPLESPSSELQFHLRHMHGVSNNSRTIFADIPQSYSDFAESYTVKTHNIITYKPPSFSAFSDARRKSMVNGQSGLLAWDGIDMQAPNSSHRETLLTLAKMTSNAYNEPDDKEWYGLGPDWNSTFSYGWEPDSDGFRGHVFVSTDNSTVVVSIKGTSVPILAGGPTMKKDKLNDNLLFSCCCARVGPTWSTVCGCYQGGNKCDLPCVENALIEKSLFYSVGINLYNNITYMYPEANIWVIGHSLGGSLASLVGITFGAPVVAFEAPGEMMAARRLHLPLPPTTHHITHVFNTADPIPMGVCNGVISTCANAGFAMESRCHFGKLMRYDTVGKLGWRVGVQNHPISTVIENLLMEDWEKPGEKIGALGRETPELVDEDNDCPAQECMTWTFGNFRDDCSSLEPRLNGTV
ncbi:Alpha/Beta hydrolase protein [Lentinula aff. detonsa]|uniref:triacylglycerol lipase n=1 Tax=Lentinula aff. detonsa TaxID=2804958 RepID=A0AA38NTN8_9AGAR|nr:Alpha/Beta hydrolase protein [Lentinula aff. detonsa]